MSRVLVTGATGFIGKRLVAELRKRSHEVVALGSAQGDIADPLTLKRFDGLDCSWVVHLAGKTFVPESWTDPMAFFRTNVLGTVNVLEFCRRNSFPLTYLSAYIYGQPEQLPITESSPARPNNPYAQSKFQAELACRFYAETFGMSVTVIRPFNVYGEGQDEKFLIPSLLQQALGEDCFRVKDLTPKRDYVYVDDLVEAVLLSRERISGFQVLNVGSGVSLSVAQVIEIIQQVTHQSKRVVCDEEVRMNEMSDVVADISKARECLGWSPRHTLADGIKKIVEPEKERV